MGNRFICKTIEGLEGIPEDHPQIAARTFDVGKTNNKEDCILIMGLNPAGDEETADAERRDMKAGNTYFYSLENAGVTNKESKTVFSTISIFLRYMSLQMKY